MSDVADLSLIIQPQQPLQIVVSTTDPLLTEQFQQMGSIVAAIDAAIGAANAAIDQKAPVQHVHSIANINGLQAALDLFNSALVDLEGKAGLSYAQASGAIANLQASLTALQATLNGKADSAHTQAISTVTGLQTALNGKADSAHTQAISTVTGLQAALDGLQASIANLQSADQSPAIANLQTSLTALQAALNSKADSAHTQAISTVTGLQAALDGLQTTLNGKADTSHTQAISTITGLQTALDNLQTTLNGKADTSHTQAISTITGLQTALNGKADTSHTHSIASVTSLQASLDSLQNQINSLQASSGSYTPPSPGLLSYTISQSSVGSGAVAGTYANLTDGSRTTGTGTGNDSFGWIKADLGSARQLDRLYVAGGSLGTWDTDVARYLNNKYLQVSLNDVDWTSLFQVSGASNTAETLLILPGCFARYIRIWGSGYTGTTEFRVWGR